MALEESKKLFFILDVLEQNKTEIWSYNFFFRQSRVINF